MSPEVTPSERAARARLQVLLELCGSVNIGELDAGDEPPGSARRGVPRSSCVVVAQPHLEIPRLPNVVAVLLDGALQDVDGGLRFGHAPFGSKNRTDRQRARTRLIRAGRIPRLSESATGMAWNEGSLCSSRCG